MTNEVVETVAPVAKAVGAKVAHGFGSQVEAGRELANRVVEWLAEKGVDFVINAVVALIILLVGMLVIRGVNAAVTKSLEKAHRGGGLFAKFVVSVVSKTCWALLAMIVLQRLGINVTPLLAGLGVTGFILGFAFQESLGNLASGMMIAINEPFKVGDFIEAGGVSGVVQGLDMMATVLTTGDNRKVVLPNKTVWGSPIVNYSAMDKRRVDIAVGVSYGTDISLARDVALEAVRSIGAVLADPAPMAEVMKLDDSAVTFAVRVWCRTADYWGVYFAAQQRVKEEFDRAGVKIPFPQLAVHLDK